MRRLVLTAALGLVLAVLVPSALAADRIYISGRYMTLIDLSTSTIHRVDGVEYMLYSPMAVSPNGRYLFGTFGYRERVAVVETETGRLIGDFTLSDLATRPGSSPFVLPPDTTKRYIVGQAASDSSLYLVVTDAHREVSRLVGSEYYVARISFSQMGLQQKAAAAQNGERPEVELVRPDSVVPIDPSISQDILATRDDRILFLQQGGDLVQVDPRSGERLGTIALRSADPPIRFSPSKYTFENGNRGVGIFRRETPDGGTVFVLGVLDLEAGTFDTKPLPGLRYTSSPVLSPDGRFLYTLGADNDVRIASRYDLKAQQVVHERPLPVTQHPFGYQLLLTSDGSSLVVRTPMAVYLFDATTFDLQKAFDVRTDITEIRRVQGR